MELREDMEKACVLANLTCNALAPSKISSTTFLEIESPISRSTLLTGESGGLSVPWSVFTLTGGQTHHPSGLAIRKIKILAIIYYIYTYSPLLLTWCVVFDLFWLLRAERSYLSLACSAVFERVRTRFVHKKYAYNCNLKLE